MGPINLYCDDSGVIAQGKEPIYHQGSKHIRKRYHLIMKM